jgi:hypothetical protein
LADFDQLAGAIPATVGVAVATPGADRVWSLGRWSTGVAWSTIKVPVAIAALRSNASRARDLADKAITESDNPASEQLWSLLGDPSDAARAVQAVLQAAGDTETNVESQRLRPGYTPFGQTEWTLANQARFAANISGVSGADIVVDLMRRLVDEQRWGLAAKGVSAKGGWGPGRDRDYLVRQFGIVPAAPGPVGVALAADAATFEAGVAAIDQLTHWLWDHLGEIAG